MDQQTVEQIKKEIDRRQVPNNFPIKIIAIDGHGGAGKSTAAEKLAKELNAEILHTDDFASWNKPVDWWTRIIDEVFERKEFRPYLTYTIWVETPRELCLKRGLERDGQDKLELWRKWFAQEDEYIARDQPRQYADLEVSGAGER
jgi:uridine kinase